MPTWVKCSEKGVIPGSQPSPVYINLDNVVHMSPGAKGSYIFFVTGQNFMEVTETVDQILAASQSKP